MKPRKHKPKRPAQPANIADIKRAIKALPDAKVEPLLNWLRNHYDGDVWDRQMAADVERLGDVGFGVALGAKPTGDPNNPFDFGELRDMFETVPGIGDKVIATTICTNLTGFAEAAKFINITCRSLGPADLFELTFELGENKDCRTLAEVEKHIGFIVRGAGFRIPAGDRLVILTGQRVKAWFRVVARPAPEQTPKWRGPSAVGKPYSTTPLP